MRNLALILCGLFLLSLTPGATDASAQTKPKASASSADASVVKQKPRYRRAAGGHIACTPSGCHRLPPGCKPQTAYYWDGTPTGYDAVVCR